MKILSFYLPQFHKVPENDKWWGEGYTEWTATKRTIPMFQEHYQPHIPLNEYYYDLLDKSTFEWQANLMHQYGIDGMCFYHYWFGKDKKILEKPAENLLKWNDIDMPFCFSWATESWLYSWSKIKGFPWTTCQIETDLKNDNGIIFEQFFGREEEWKKHFDYLLPFFKDKRYIRYQGKPVFIFHWMEDIYCIQEMIEYWRELAIEYGLNGLYIIGGGFNDFDYGSDAITIHEPGIIRGELTNLNNLDRPIINSYKIASDSILKRKLVENNTEYITTFCSFDNTPRYGIDGVVFQDANPDVFCEFLAKTMAKSEVINNEFVFIDAWNEWGEGMHLEPDEKYKFQWLEAVKNAKKIYHNYMKLYSKETIYMSKEEHELRIKLKKSTMYLECMSQWMFIKQKNITFCNWLKNKNYNRVLLYGNGIFAKHLVEELTDNLIQVDGIIDKSISEKYIDKIKCFHMEDELPKSDCIIVTSFYYLNEICKMIRRYDRNIPIISIRELIDVTINNY